MVSVHNIPNIWGNWLERFSAGVLSQEMLPNPGCFTVFGQWLELACQHRKGISDKFRGTGGDLWLALYGRVFLLLLVWQLVMGPCLETSCNLVKFTCTQKCKKILYFLPSSLDKSTFSLLSCYIVISVYFSAWKVLSRYILWKSIWKYCFGV